MFINNDIIKEYIPNFKKDRIIIIMYFIIIPIILLIKIVLDLLNDCNILLIGPSK